MFDGRKHFQPGDWVIYTKAKFSTRPGPRAKEISPAEHGDNYSYLVDKFWVVAAPETDGSTLLLRTRRGKTKLVEANDPNLHRATLWQRLFYRNRFPRIDDGEESGEPAAVGSQHLATG